MVEKIILTIPYKGFVVQKVLFSGGAAVMRGGPAKRSPPSSFEQWRITVADGSPLKYVRVESHEAALRKIDSGEARKLLIEDSV